jgi:hypothetical protein
MGRKLRYRRVFAVLIVLIGLVAVGRWYMGSLGRPVVSDESVSLKNLHMSLLVYVEYTGSEFFPPDMHVLAKCFGEDDPRQLPGYRRWFLKRIRYAGTGVRVDADERTPLLLYDDSISQQRPKGMVGFLDGGQRYHEGREWLKLWNSAHDLMWHAPPDRLPPE